MSTEYTFEGVIREPNGRPASGVVVLVIDADSGPDDPLGVTTTGVDGGFSISADAEAVGGPEEGGPEPRIHVFDGGERLAEEPVPAGDDSVEVTVDRSDATMPSMGEAMEMMEEARHGAGLRGMTNTPRAPTQPGRGRFGRMFPYLEAADHDVSFLRELGLPGNELDESVMGSVADSGTPSGFVFVGQFIDHDITLDPLSSLSRQVDPDAIRNFRTPRLDLDSVYGSGPEVSRHLYESPFAGGTRDRLLLAKDRPDLPRNREGTALVGDPRNDENHILSQFQYAMLNFHNRIFEWLPHDTKHHFERAQQLARWHYQWLVLEEYLPTVCDPDVVDAVREERRHYTVGHDEQTYMPLEFAGAAYRFGHSQTRLRYRVNDEVEGRLFGHGPDALGMGFEPVSERAAVDWGHLFEMGRDIDTQPARKIDPLLAPDLLDLPFVHSDDDWRRSLASRNLVRGYNLGLPSGQAVARAMGVDPISNATMGFDEILEAHGQPADTEAPLWYYVLAEARELGHGEHLGPVGSRIVAEVVVGLVESDPRSFLTVQPNWTPTLPTPCSGASDDFSVADLLAFALDGE
ncbi:peroxidase family protein [Haloplanus salilacus]|uniref:peroxidase family protein n=1 Tax=Haloplanus salilacus TaxID=2949994 RepID=UPI0030CD9201